MFLMLVGSDLIHFSPRVCLTYQHAGRVPAHHLGPHLCLLHDGGELLGVQQQQALERMVQSRDQLDISEIVTFILGQIFFEDGRWIFRTCSV